MASYNSFKKINSDAIVDGSLANTDIGPGQVSSEKIANGAVTAAKFADGNVTTEKLAASIDLSGKTVSYRPITNADVNVSADIAGDKLGSGAATTNLGYTPVNKAGDAMTGNLRVQAGSAGSPSIRGNDSNTGIYFPNNNDIRFVTNGSDSMRIDGSGRTQFPRRPAFAACGTAGWRYANSYGGSRGQREIGGPMNYTTGHQTGGSNFSNGNGRFTAPVAGWYCFQTIWYLYNNNNNTNEYWHTFIRRNNNANTAPGNRAPHTIVMHGNRNNHEDGMSQTNLMYMNSGQYASLGAYFRGNQGRHHCGHQIFSGYLIG